MLKMTELYTIQRWTVQYDTSRKQPKAFVCCPNIRHTRLLISSIGSLYAPSCQRDLAPPRWSQGAPYVRPARRFFIHSATIPYSTR